MLLIIDLLEEDRKAAKAQQHKIMNGSAYDKFKDLMNTERVSRIWETGLDLQEAYNKWNDRHSDRDQKRSVKLRKKNRKKQTRE